jgi:rhamnosyltransferase
VGLIHQLGTKTAHKTIKGNLYITHSPVRIYYNVRNGVVLFRRYFFKQPKWTLIALFNCIREGIYLLLYQPNRPKNFFLLLRAWFDGLFNRLGKF